MLRLTDKDLAFTRDFEEKIDVKMRRKHGIHFTPIDLIIKVLTHILLEDWEERLEKQSSKRKLKQDFLSYTVLDPACGAGNFLFVAEYILNHIVAPKIQFGLRIPKENFFGIEIKPDIFEICQKFTGFSNIILEDSLFIKWPKTSIVVGNPPFLGGSRIRTELGDQALEKIKKEFPDFSLKADYCCLWFHKAIKDCDPGTRVGFIATNSILSTNSKKMSLDRVEETGGELFKVYESQKWV
ncbi:MAG: N-6 DNA methylase [Ignavibacteriaceae bacterium]|nr:N-6 DNA methylase [Ignavibacteriaceae bacterium]